jgi:hypothetical protein
MRNATLRANARTLSDETERAAEIRRRVRERYSEPGLLQRGIELLAHIASQNALADSLAAEFEAVWKQEDAISGDDTKTDEESDAAIECTRKLADKILTVSAENHLGIIRLKARVYLWAQGESFESFSKSADVTTEKAMVSILRDLGADRPIGPRMENTEARS